MDKHWGDVACKFVYGAVEGKYQSLNEELVRSMVDGVFASGQTLDESGLMGLLRPVRSFREDIENQAVVLLILDRYWRRNRPAGIVQLLHSATLGAPRSQPQFRRMVRVKDFPGELRVSVADIPGAFGELELAIAELGPVFAECGVAAKATFLAWIFSEIIRVHPFEDGNGRTARFTVQYCLRLWDLPFMVLPKVRNDVHWAKVVTDAVNGKSSGLSAEFARRLASHQL